MSDILPVVDLNNFFNDDKKSMNDFVQQLGNAYKTVGFVAVKNHGISNELLQSCIIVFNFFLF